MAKSSTLYVTQNYRNTTQTFTDVDGTNTKLLIDAGADDSNIIGISITSTSATDDILLLYLYDSSTDFLIGSFPVPALSGSNGIVYKTNGLNKTILAGITLDGNGNPYIPLAAGYSLRAALINGLSNNGEQTTVIVTAEDF